MTKDCDEVLHTVIMNSNAEAASEIKCNVTALVNAMAIGEDSSWDTKYYSAMKLR